MKLHLLDGTYELFRSYFGAPRRRAPDGREVGAVRGIVASTLALLADPEVTHIAAAFDSVIPSFRNDMYPGYKTGEGVDQDLLDQFQLAERAMASVGVTVWSMYDYEADDALGTAAWRWSDDVEQVIILTPDKDLTQCVSGRRIVAYDRRKQMLIDEPAVVAKFGVSPRSIPDYLALVGDSADGFPGLPGWGAKSSATLLARYGSLERIPLDASLWDVNVRGGDKLAATMREHMASALLFRFLASLRRDVPLQEDLGDLEWRGVRAADYRALCAELGFNDLAQRPQHWLE